MCLGMITVVGRCVGAQDFDQAIRYTKKLMLWDYIAQGLTNAVVLACWARCSACTPSLPRDRALHPPS